MFFKHRGFLYAEGMWYNGSKGGVTMEQTVFMNMCMACDGSRILLQNRVKKYWPGVCFPGGHVEPGEAFTDAVIREVWEETGLKISQPELCGIKQWSDDGIRHVVLLYRTTSFTGALHGSEEGQVFWAERADLEKYPLATGFAEDLVVFESDDVNEIFFTGEEGNRNREYR